MTANPYDQCKKNNKAGFLHLKNRNTLKHVFKEKVAIHPEHIISFKNKRILWSNSCTTMTDQPSLKTT